METTQSTEFKEYSLDYGGNIFKFIDTFLNSTKKALCLNQSFPDTVYRSTWVILSENLKGRNNSAGAENFKVNLNQYKTDLSAFLDNLNTLESLFADYSNNFYDTKNGVNVKNCDEDIFEKLSANKIFSSDAWRARANNISTRITTLKNVIASVKSQIQIKSKTCQLYIERVDSTIQQIDARVNLLSKIYNERDTYFKENYNTIISEYKTTEKAAIQTSIGLQYKETTVTKYKSQITGKVYNNEEDVLCQEEFYAWWQKNPYYLTDDDKATKIGTTRSNN